jgi:hypothetical protein
MYELASLMETDVGMCLSKELQEDTQITVGDEN